LRIYQKGWAKSIFSPNTLLFFLRSGQASSCPGPGSRPIGWRTERDFLPGNSLASPVMAGLPVSRRVPPRRESIGWEFLIILAFRYDSERAAITPGSGKAWKNWGWRANDVLSANIGNTMGSYLEGRAVTLCRVLSVNSPRLVS
jgi:hypothetical protein